MEIVLTRENYDFGKGTEILKRLFGTQRRIAQQLTPTARISLQERSGYQFRHSLELSEDIVKFAKSSEHPIELLHGAVGTQTLFLV